MRFVIHDQGRMVDEYLSVPDYFGPLPPGDALALRANPTVVSRLTGAEPSRVRAVARTARASGRPSAGRGALRADRRRARAAAVITLYDSARCPYCARVRIVLAEKGVAYEPVAIDLSNRPGVAVREESGRQGAGARGGHARAARVGGDHGVPRGALSRSPRCFLPIRRSVRSSACASFASTRSSATTTTRSAAETRTRSPSGCGVRAAGATASRRSRTCRG